MMKTINLFLLVWLMALGLGTSSYGQYHGGDAASAASDQLGLASCGIPAHFYAYFGSTDDNVTVDVLMTTSCSAPPPSFFAYMGGENDSAGVELLSATTCGTPPSFFAYMGGEQDSAHVDELLAVSCGTPAQFYAYFGSSDDGFAMDAIGSCPITPPVADFTASASATCVGGTIDFTDNSTNIPSVWSWTFAGGTPATSTVQNPTVQYNSPGIYAVSLTATNYNGSNTKTMTGYITVTAVPTVASVTPAARCDAGSVNLQATASAGVLRWYNVPANGSILGTGTNFPTGIISATTTYYVEAASGSCVSARTPVLATINSTPTVDTTTPGSRCGTGSVTLSATASSGTLSWFAATSGGTALATGASFATPSISTNTTYYVQATSGTCISARVPVLATVNTAPTVTSTTPASRCDAGSVTLGATASSGTLNWYAAPTGGSLLGTGTSFVTPPISSNTNYYVEATDGGCTSARVAVLASASPTPAILVTVPASRCDTGTLTLGATASAGTLNWYDSPAGGTSLGTGTFFLTPVLTTTTTYYVAATNGSCVSARTPVIATVTDTPSVTSVTPASRCGTGTLTLGAAASAGVLNWYSGATGGSLLGSGTAFVTPAINATTTYYVEATNGSCSSARTPVTATVSVMPVITATTPASRCDTGALTLSASATAGTLNWYAAATGGTSLGTGNAFTTPDLSSTTTYYVEATSGSCTSARTPVTATVNATPTILSVTAGSRCGAGSVSLNATTTSGAINWYAVSTGGTLLATGSNFATPNISTTTTYYAEAVNGSCVAARVPVVATINAIPAITTTTPASRCDSGSVTLQATADAGSINWYDAATGGNLLATGNSFATPSLNATTVFYAEAANSNCTSPRVAVNAIVNSTPNIISTTPASRCDSGSVTLQAIASAGALNWYAAATGGPVLGSGNSFTTPNLSASTTYYVEATTGDCTSVRTPVLATVNTTPTLTSTTPGQRCGTGTVTLGATSTAGPIRWYAGPAGGAPLATSTTFTTPVISVTTTYYAEPRNGSCIGPRTPIIATVVPFPTVITTAGASICGTGSATLEATASAGTIDWFDAETGGTLLGTGSLFDTGILSGTTVFYAQATNGDCTSARTPVTAAVVTVPAPTGSENQTFCSGETVGQLLAVGTDISWYDAPTGGSLVADSTPLVAGTTYYASQNDGSCDSSTRLAVTVAEGACLGVEVPTTNVLQVYPNPVNDWLTVAYTQPLTHIEVVNMLGQRVMAKTPTANQIQLDLSGLAAGAYLVKVDANGLQQTVKVIKR